MRIVVFSAKPYDAKYLELANAGGHDLVFLETRLAPEAVPLAVGADAVCTFVSDDLGAPVISALAEAGVRLIALRSAGFNHVDLAAAEAAGIAVAWVPAYSPYAVAKHAVAMMLTLNRKMHRADNRLREGNFTLEGLLGFDMYGKAMGIVGTGQIDEFVARILNGFGCSLLAHDPVRNPACDALGVRYVGRVTIDIASRPPDS